MAAKSRFTNEEKLHWCIRMQLGEVTVDDLVRDLKLSNTAVKAWRVRFEKEVKKHLKARDAGGQENGKLKQQSLFPAPQPKGAAQIVANGQAATPARKKLGRSPKQHASVNMPAVSVMGMNGGKRPPGLSGTALADENARLRQMLVDHLLLVQELKEQLGEA